MAKLSQMIENNSAFIVEEGQLFMEHMLVQVQIFEQGRCSNQVVTKFSSDQIVSNQPKTSDSHLKYSFSRRSHSWSKLILVANMKSVSFWGLNMHNSEL